MSLIDLFPTLTELAGIPEPVHPGARGEAPLPLDGFSLGPLMRGGTDWAGPEAVLTAVGSSRPLPRDAMQQAAHQHFSLRDGSFRYIRGRSGADRSDHPSHDGMLRDLEASCRACPP
mgnify:CR=1 FL=1